MAWCWALEATSRTRFQPHGILVSPFTRRLARRRVPSKRGRRAARRQWCAATILRSDWSRRWPVFSGADCPSDTVLSWYKRALCAIVFRLHLLLLLALFDRGLVDNILGHQAGSGAQFGIQCPHRTPPATWLATLLPCVARSPLTATRAAPPTAQRPETGGRAWSRTRFETFFRQTSRRYNCNVWGRRL